MTGKHSTKSKTPVLERPEVDMPDPDNLQIDLSTLPLTGPISLPRGSWSGSTGIPNKR
ncbi:MAG: hypothetical protein KKH51_02410 [Actinobacteria bacterium]|nr:hypothetical protein [Actinomycetota bacterium]